MEIERRGIEIELRTPDEEKRNSISGYAAVFNSVSEDLGGFREIILPGAFNSVLARNPDVRALVNHDTSRVLGRTINQTLDLRSDETGLAFSVDLPNTTFAKDLRSSVRRGDISGASFAFTVGYNDYDIRFEGDELIREIRNIASLFEVSVVTFPAYQATAVSARSLKAVKEANKPKISESYRDLYLLKISCELDGILL